MDYKNVLGEHKFPTYEELKNGLLRLIDEGKISREDAERLLPELRESEDERIRKAIVATIEQCPDDFLNPKNRDRMLEWLEKQKEPKHAPDDLQKSFEAGQTSIVDYPEQYGLCKKAEWSEEDEKHINLILRVLDIQQCWDGATGKKFNPYQDEIDWLKSLRPSWKPSEEQMDALKELIDDANRAGWVTPGATELYEQLKKL